MFKYENIYFIKIFFLHFFKHEKMFFPCENFFFSCFAETFCTLFLFFSSVSNWEKEIILQEPCK